MPENNALVLEVLRQDEALKMSAYEQKELASTLRHYSQISFASAQIQKLCLEITSILNKADRKGVLESDGFSALKKAGQLLWEQLFTPAVKNKLKSTSLLDLVLAIDEELVSIPWELLYTGEDFLCLKFNVGRLVRTKREAGASSPQYRSSNSVLKMLLLVNPTNDLKSAYLEGINIKNQFDRQRTRMRINFKSTDIDTLYVKKNLSDYDIVHFAGHCEYDRVSPEDSGWVLSDGRFTTSDILALAQGMSLPSLVFSNACSSAQPLADLVDADYQERAYSMAGAFLFSGVRHYIGAIRKIEDQDSLVFAKEFYTQLIKGKSLGECLRLARLRLIREYGITATSWTNYLLYGDPNFVFFRAKTEAHRPKIRLSWRSYKKIFAGLALFILI
ncbi:MAG: CHAT domain-containing protein, partial [Candidatus Omnitrophica bacterium]|nr:CHAT domain-containing protein [Candidatus Omnitrophota bacterium]